MRALPVLAVLAVLVLMAALLAAASAHAQNQTPGFNLPQIITNEEVESLSVDFDEAFGAIENPYLSDILKLNYQISLLEKMVARQGELQKITDSYKAMGVSFQPPPPARGICAQLPPNAPCLEHHPDLYSDLVNERKAYYDELAAKARASDPNAAAADENDEAARARREKEEAERKAREAARERRSRYRWSDVTCLAGDCRGVIVAASNNGFRATVRKGVRLPDGTLVRSVNADGITVVIDGESIDLRPAPGEASGTATAAAGTGNPLAAAMAASLAGGSVMSPSGVSAGSAAASAAAAAATAALAASGAGGAGSTGGTPPSGVSAPAGAPAEAGGSGGAGQSMAEPALGPSGLF